MASKEEKENAALRDREDEVGQQARKEHEEQLAEEQKEAAEKSPQTQDAP